MEEHQHIMDRVRGDGRLRDVSALRKVVDPRIDILRDALEVMEGADNLHALLPGLGLDLALLHVFLDIDIGEIAIKGGKEQLPAGTLGQGAPAAVRYPAERQDDRDPRHGWKGARLLRLAPIEQVEPEFRDIYVVPVAAYLPTASVQGG